MSTLAGFSAVQLALIFNAVTTGAPVKRFESRAVGLTRTLAEIEKNGLTVDQALQRFRPMLGGDLPVAAEAACAPAPFVFGPGRIGLTIEASPEEALEAAKRLATLLRHPVSVVDDSGVLGEVTPAGRTEASRKPGARTAIIEACSRAAGASSVELFATTGWKRASWHHQLKLAAAATGRLPVVEKVDGTKRYFLRPAA